MQDTVRNVLLGQEGFFESSKGGLQGKQRVELLKAIEGESVCFCFLASDSTLVLRCRSYQYSDPSLKWL